MKTPDTLSPAENAGVSLGGNATPAPESVAPNGLHRAATGAGVNFNHQLRALANWLLLRSVGNHDRQTTLTTLAKAMAEQWWKL